MGIIAAFVLVSGPRERFVDLEVRLENASPPVDNTFDDVRVILEHHGGDPLGIPSEPDDEFNVIGRDLWGDLFENRVAWDNWEFKENTGWRKAGPGEKFEFGDTIRGILRYDGWNLQIGDELRITIYDIYSDKVIFSRTRTIENSALY